MTTVADIEAAAHRALAGHREERDGWVLRIDRAQRARRANSATTPVELAPRQDAIAEVVAWYEARDAAPLIRVLSTSETSIQQQLDAAGWGTEGRTKVLIRAINTAAPSGVMVDARPPPEWVEMRARLGSGSQGALDLEAAHADHEFGYVTTDISVGRAVRDGALIGILDVATLPAARRRGGATDVMRVLMAWGAGRGAATCWLQVEADNAPALALYDRLGFALRYEYWYRRPPSTR